MPYAPLEWKDGPEGGTPISAANLNRMEQGIKDAHDEIDILKATKSTVGVVTGVLNHGHDLPLPDGFDEEDCYWEVSLADIEPNWADEHWLRLQVGVGDESTRDVFCILDQVSGKTFGKVNFKVVGVK